MNPPIQGQVVAAFSRQYMVELSDGELLPCLTHGKKSEVACGDIVEIQRISDAQGVIKHILPRQTLLYRSDAYRQKLIAANITQIIVVVAARLRSATNFWHAASSPHTTSNLQLSLCLINATYWKQQ